VAHMNLVTLGILVFNTMGQDIIQSVNHGFVSGGMFLLEVLYERYPLFLYYFGALCILCLYMLCY
jgi:NADH:ubiquinone oxidoreductase subunit 4 (subunit M)